MGSRVAAIIKKEFIQIRRDRRTLAIVLVLPVMQLLLLGYAINTVVDHLPTIVVDGSDPNIAQTALFAAGVVTQAHSATINAGTIARLGQGRTAGGVELRPVVLYNPSMLSANFMVPGIIGMIMQFQTLILTAFAVVRERERGTLEQLIVTPIKPWELMLGKLLPYTVTSSVGATVALVAGRVLFGVEIAGSITLLAVFSVLFLLGSLGLGLL